MECEAGEIEQWHIPEFRTVNRRNTKRKKNKKSKLNVARFRYGIRYILCVCTQKYNLIIMKSMTNGNFDRTFLSLSPILSFVLV